MFKSRQETSLVYCTQPKDKNKKNKKQKKIRAEEQVQIKSMKGSPEDTRSRRLKVFVEKIVKDCC